MAGHRQPARGGPLARLISAADCSIGAPAVGHDRVIGPLAQLDIGESPEQRIFLSVEQAFG